MEVLFYRISNDNHAIALRNFENKADINEIYMLALSLGLNLMPEELCSFPVKGGGITHSQVFYIDEDLNKFFNTDTYLSFREQTTARFPELIECFNKAEKRLKS